MRGNDVTPKQDLMLAEAEFHWLTSQRKFAEAAVVYRRLRRLKTIQLDAEICARIADGDTEAATESVGAQHEHCA